MSIKTIFSTLSLAAVACICSCQQRPYPVYFHTEADGLEEGAKSIFIYNNTPYTKMPILSQHYFKNYRSFLAQDGSYGVELFVKDEYRLRLEHISNQYRGKKLLPVVNGLVFEPQKLGRPIVDGELVIWSGLNGYDLKQIARTIDPVDPELEKKRFKDKNPRKLPPRPKNQNQVKDHTGRVIGEIYQG